MNEFTKREPDGYSGMPVVFMAGDPPTPAPFLMNRDDVIRFFRLHDGKGTKCPAKTIQRYRKIRLRTARVGLRVFFRLDDVPRFLDAQQERGWRAFK